MSHAEDHQGTRRDFIYYATAGAGAVATGAAVWPQQARVPSGLQKHLGPLPGVGHVSHLLCDALFEGVHGEGWRDRVLDAPIKALGR